MYIEMIEIYFVLLFTHISLLLLLFLLLLDLLLQIEEILLFVLRWTAAIQHIPYCTISQLFRIYSILLFFLKGFNFYLLFQNIFHLMSQVFFIHILFMYFLQIFNLFLLLSLFDMNFFILSLFLLLILNYSLIIIIDIRTLPRTSMFYTH